jgi:hypothetical protein
MKVKIIAAIFICFYSGLGFSQTKKVLCFFDGEIAVSEGNVSCFGGGNYKSGKEHYSISLFSDSTFLISYSRKGDVFPDYMKNEIATGRFYNQNDSLNFITKTIAEVMPVPDKHKASRLGQSFGGLPLRVEFSADNLSFYNSAGGCFITLYKANFFEKYRSSKIAPTCYSFPFISSEFLNTRSLF